MSLGVALLGSTGSIGRSALAVLQRHRDAFHVVALAANRNAAELAQQVAQFSPKSVALVDTESLQNGALAAAQNWRTGRAGVVEVASHPDADIVINAIVGAAGLEATIAALESGKRLALANKESLVAGGPLVLDALARGGGSLVPVDSEHSAILQCLRGAHERELKRIVLTASGGPFRSFSKEALKSVSRDDALRHPTWDMGAKITIDSATLANKALEIIEAHFLFGLDYDHIDAVVHPQSIIHSMVEFADGSVLAQMGFPNMELPILYALTHPERLPDTGTRAFDPVTAGQLTFEPVDLERFRAFKLGVEAGRIGGSAPAVYNAANEVAVAAFLANDLPFPAIADVIDGALQDHVPQPVDSLKSVLEADRAARASARNAIQKVQC